MKTAVLGLYHEANSFSAVPADLPAFSDGGLFLADELERSFASSRSTIGGFYKAAGPLGLELEPLVFARVNPCGPITKEAFAHIADLMVSGLGDGERWGGVLLAWHGAAVADGHLDADGELLARIRTTVGEKTPVGAVLDMHANVSPAALRAIDILIGYQTNPHVDAEARGIDCTGLLARIMAGKSRPARALCRIPLAPNITRQGTDDEPMRSLLAQAHELQEQSGLLALSLFQGFPYADVPQMGMSVVAMAEDAQSADSAACSLAQAVWERREEFLGHAPGIEEALVRAKDATYGPVVLFDVGDNIGGGGPGDSVAILAKARELGVSGLVQTVADASSARRCAESGTGSRVDLDVGGKHPDSPTPPLRTQGVVRRLTNGQFEELNPVHAGFRSFDSGPTALVATDDGNHLILTSRIVPNVSLQQLRSIGIDPSESKMIVAKGVNAPRAAYERIATELVWVDTPGVTRMSFTSLDYRQRNRPMFPFEDDVKFTPAVARGS